MSKETESPLFTEYEKILLSIFENATFKTISAIELYNNKYSYNESYFLCIIAQEELAKLSILPIARELGEMEKILKDRNSSYYKHSIKQKIFTNFGLQNRTHDDIEKIKQGCLYVGIDLDGKPKFEHIKPAAVFQEIKHTALFLAHNYRIVLLEDSFKDNFKKAVNFFIGIAYGCVKDRLPELQKEILLEAEVLSTKNKKELEQEYHKALFTNPYELIKIFKAVFKQDYLLHLKKLGFFTIPELESYLKRNIKNY